MMCDLKKRTGFARVVNYVNSPKKARLIDGKDVRLDDNAAIARSMQGQADDKPGRKLKNPVYHISLDFAREDTPRLTDGLMAEIAREYMKRMGITDTQYIVCRHTDTEHQHVHIVANRVDNNGKTISDSNDDVRNIKVCRAITEKYGLHIASGKTNVKRDRLRGKDKAKYNIYDAVRKALPHCRSWADLDRRLSAQGIGIRFRYNSDSGAITGVAFTKGKYSFYGSKVDRSMGFFNLDRQLNGHLLEAGEQRRQTDSEQYRQKQAEMRWEGKLPALDSRPGRTVETGLTPDNTFTGGKPDTPPVKDDNTGTSEPSVIQITVGALIELLVQPHQAKVSSGGGGGNDNGWSDDEKNKYKPRRRR